MAGEEVLDLADRVAFLARSVLEPGVLLGLALYFVFNGGQVTVIVTDFLQGTFVNLVFVVVIVLMPAAAIGLGLVVWRRRRR